ncbi:p-loop containing nucleoside triphosphate hydrolase [Venustampulla echinocandica]|uniref:p-loop containing nucleoside triphosphate hydrolase n=1 Tax=Venustampulla echinocandica TaxID=2656787 RepID=A0A370TJP4_9HELO|nr:p-loop containing nucleoside triphosphate hydrolase [Venustampulla echinocandica]RDL35743.1 p-loop containing nucleoside triphosphate hydrolase [Venustampulla echinocandica]
MSDSITHRPALGHVAAIGTLYDARNDTFLPRSLFTGQLPADAIVRGDISKKTVNVNYVDSYKVRFQEMGLSTELSASILAGLVPVGGSGHYLSEERDSNYILLAALHHKITTVQESLNLMSSGMRSCLGITSLSTKEATHVVTEIEWGAQSFITARHRLLGNVERSIVEQRFQAQVKTFEESITAPVHSVHGNDHGGMGADLPLEITAYGDILADNGIRMHDFQEANNFLGLIPQNIKHENGGKGTPVTYKLVPVGMLPMFLPIQVQVDSTVTPPSADCLQRFVLLFDQIRAGQQRMNDYHSFVRRHKLYIPDDHVRSVEERISAMKSAETHLKSSYARVLQNARSGVDDPGKVWDLLKDPSVEKFSPQSITDITESHREKVELIQMMVANGASYIGYNDLDVDRELAKVRGIDAYVFAFSQTAMKDKNSWDGNKKLLFDLLTDRSSRKFVAIVDYDARKKTLETSRISHFRDRKEVVGDLLDHRKFLAEKSFARYAQGTLDTEVTQKPLKRRFVKIACPSSRCQQNGEQDWVCFQCHAPLEYGFSDPYIYCDCGRSQYSNYQFKCSSQQHGPGFEQYDQQVLNALLNSLTARDNLNILILGETGVGKSTFINAFVNYLTFETLDEAMKSEGLNWVIPCSFSTQIMDRTNPDSKIEQKKIVVGSRADEKDGSKGASATQETTVYPVTIGTTTIRLIDTPGIGDTRGLEFDKKNMADILATLSNYEELHGILILLKSNNARLTTMFSFCVKELLTHLHRDSARNMAFGFTNTRISNYTPGDTFGSLETLLNQHPDVGLSLSIHTTYCFDSESFRYLAAYKMNVPMDNFEDFRRSWGHSRQEANRLLDHFQSQTPHLVQSTISLNSSREVITQLTVPMTEISQLINRNIAIAEDKIQELKDHRLKGDDLRKRLHVSKVQYNPQPLSKPRTVCCDTSCTEYRADGNQEDKSITVYKSHCHAVCYLTDVAADVRSHPGLIHCAAFSGSNYCTHCSHHWQEHMHILYELHEQPGTVTDLEIEKQLKDHADDITLRQTAITNTDQLVNEYKNEHAQIQEAAAQFGLFLKKWSITGGYNDATLEYLDILIKEEEGKVGAGGSKKKLNALLLDRAKHVEIVKILEHNMKYDPNARLLNEQEVDALVRKLYNLKHFGKNLRKVKQAITAAHEATYRERPYRVKNSRGRPRSHFKPTDISHGIPNAIVGRIQQSLPSRPQTWLNSTTPKTTYQEVIYGATPGTPVGGSGNSSQLSQQKKVASAKSAVRGWFKS